MGKSAAIPAQMDFVDDIVLPHFYVFCSDRVLAQSADCSIADPRDLCPLLERYRRIETSLFVARPLQSGGRVAADLFLPIGCN